MAGSGWRLTAGSAPTARSRSTATPPRKPTTPRKLRNPRIGKRKKFNRMNPACKRGGIDLILTKSLSRFARNTVDCLETVRMLKARGSGVIFEKENINTLTESSEFLITLFSGFAQAESE